MKATDYIKIPGTPPGSGHYAECLQGLIGTESAVVTQAIWAAQTKMILGQNSFIDLVKDIFGKKAKGAPKLSDDRNGFIKDWLTFFAAWGITIWFDITSNVVQQIIQFALGKVWDAVFTIVNLFKKYGQVFDAMKEENNALAVIPRSDAAYTIRRQVLFDHYAQINVCIDVINQASNDITSVAEVLPKEWTTWAKDMNKEADDLATWIDQAYTAMETETVGGHTSRSMSETPQARDANPGEVIMPNPALPELPRPIPEPPHIPKPPGAPDRMTTLLAAYFRTDLMLKTHALRHQIQHGRQLVQVIADVGEDVEALQYNDEVIDFGTVRLLLKSKIIEY